MHEGLLAVVAGAPRWHLGLHRGQVDDGQGVLVPEMPLVTATGRHCPRRRCHREPLAEATGLAGCCIAVTLLTV